MGADSSYQNGLVRCCLHPCSHVFFPSIINCYRFKVFCVVFISDFSVYFLYQLPNLWCFVIATQSTFRNPTPKFPKIHSYAVPAQSLFVMLVTMGAILGIQLMFIKHLPYTTSSDLHLPHNSPFCEEDIIIILLYRSGTRAIGRFINSWKYSH